MNHRRLNLRILLLLLTWTLPATSDAAPPTPPRQTLIDDAWLFHPGDIAPPDPALTATFDDSHWQPVDLPHDYVLDGPYVRNDDKPERTHGFLPCDVGWYRKHLSIPASDAGRILRLDFDGVFRDSQVWLNGQLLGRHPGGYAPFSYDITKLAHVGADNTLIVRVDPREFEGHWYEGGGIYRHVHLTSLAPLHVAQWGTQIISTVPNGDHGAADQANLTIITTLENNAPLPADAQLLSEILAPDGHSLQTLTTSQPLPATGSHDVIQQTTIDHPKLWSLDAPNLYQLRTTILQAGHPVDTLTTPFGIRTIHFDPDHGFFLNGTHVEIQGAANHQDLPAVGIAVPDSLQAWRVAQLKKMGCNGWRTAHNPPNDALLDACDRQGMLVMEENRHLGDAYGHHSLPGTTANDLSDLAAMIRRDRNHPSVIMWSLCNEEGLRGKPEGMALFAKMTQMVHRYDQTRPLTSAINGSWIAKGIADQDLLGVNYHAKEYDAFHHANPTIPMFASEGTNQKTTRGEYAEDPARGMCSAYNLCETDLCAVLQRPFIAGTYTWTGFDYRGEPNPHGWPDISNHTGLMDVCGFPKDKYYYFQSCWSKQPMVHLLPSSWNWTAGQTLRVLAFSNAKRVELFLNGQPLGSRDVPYGLHAEWQVPYAPGELAAKAYTDDQLVATDSVQTTTAPTHLKLTTDWTSLRAGTRDAAIIALSLLDDHDRIVPDDDRRITFHLTGPARLLGVANGNPADHDPDRADNRNTFHGRCIFILEAGQQPGDIQITAASPTLQPTRILLPATPTP